MRRVVRERALRRVVRERSLRLRSYRRAPGVLGALRVSAARSALLRRALRARLPGGTRPCCMIARVTPAFFYPMIAALGLKLRLPRARDVPAAAHAWLNGKTASGRPATRPTADSVHP
ncbi:MAG TPA: hypothetical protein PLT38_01110 [Rubrivivax sp.]|nr:hypothetical protein [Rubrivivax sp.]